MSNHSSNRHIIATSFFLTGFALLLTAWHHWAGWLSLNETAPVLVLAALALTAGLHYSNPEGGS